MFIDSMESDFRYAGIGVVREGVVEIFSYDTLYAFLSIDVGGSVLKIVECPYVVETSDMVLVGVCEQNGVDSFYVFAEHLLAEVGTGIDDDCRSVVFD